MFQANYKDIRKRQWLWAYFTPFSIVSNVYFEKANFCWGYSSKKLVVSVTSFNFTLIRKLSDNILAENDFRYDCLFKHFEKLWKLIIFFALQKQPPEVYCRKGVLKSFAKFTWKHLCQSLFFNKVACLRLATFLKKRLWHRCFPANFAEFLRTFFS